MKKNLTKNGLMTIILSFLMTPVFSQSGNNIVIDNFNDDGVISIEATSESQRADTVIQNANVIGGEREMIAELISGSRSVVADVQQGDYALSVGAGSTGKGTLIYDGSDGDSDNIDFRGLGGIDLERGLDAARQTEDRFKFSVKASDLDGSITITVYSDEDRSSSVTRNFDGEANFEIMFSEFEGNADFNDVGAIVIETGGTNIDLILDRICTEGPERTCEISSVVAGAPVCDGFENYTVTVQWSGSDETVTIFAGGDGVPESKVALGGDEGGSVTFTYPIGQSAFSITVSDSEGVCEAQTLTGEAPICQRPCELTLNSSKNCIDSSSYSVTVTWEGLDESITFNAGGSGVPASVTTEEASGSVTFIYPNTDEVYNITTSDYNGSCEIEAISGSAVKCGVPTMGEWGLICLSLIFLILGTQAMRQYVFKPSLVK